MAEGQPGAGPAGLAGIVRRFRWPLVAIALVGAYAAAGFLLAPWLLAREIPVALREAIDREARVGGIEVNPFTLTLRLRELEVRERDGSRLAALEEIYVDLEVESLLRRALVLAEVNVRAPYLNVVRARSGAINLLELQPREPAPAPATGEQELPRLIVGALRVTDGVVDFTDLGPAEAFRTKIGPFAIALDELSTLPQATGRHDVVVTLESGTRIAVNGDLVVNPLRANGSFRLEGPFLGTVQRYVKEQLAFGVEGGQTLLSARFDVAERPGSELEVAVSDVDLRVTGVRLTAETAPDFLALAELSVSGGELIWPAREAGIAAATVKGLAVRARRDRDGSIDIASLLVPRGPSTTEPGTDGPAVEGEAAAPPWKLRAGQVTVEDCALQFTDAGPAEPAVASIADLDLRLRDLDNQPGTRMPLEIALALGGGGTITATGSMAVLPDFDVDAAVRAEGIRLTQAQPWIAGFARVEVRDGALALDGRLKSRPAESLAFEGDLAITALDVQDLVKKERLLAWRELGIDDLAYGLDANKARIARIRLVGPFARLFIARDQSTNLDALLIDQPAGPPVAEESAPLALRIGKVAVRGGDVDFADLSLPLPFAARIRELGGEFSTIDTRSAAPSRLALEGRVDEYGFARVDGQVRFSDPTSLADIGVVFRNVEMPALSPYTVKFAGRRIARGRIDLDLRYQLEDRRLVGANRIVINELELGEKVPHPEAADLPLGLAVALLKDADGRIDIDMPVSGSLDDPEFGIGSVLWKAFVNLVTKVATAPFRLLGGLVGAGSEDLGSIAFAPGRADLLPPEREKLARVGDALGKRPGLSLTIPAVVDPDADSTVLRIEKASRLVEAELAAAGKSGTGRGGESRTRAAIEALFLRQFPDVDLAPIRESFTTPPRDAPEGQAELDELAYLDELRGRLAAAQVIGEEDLGALARERAEAIAGELSAGGQAAPGRVRIGERREVAALDGQWVTAELAVTAD